MIDTQANQLTKKNYISLKLSDNQQEITEQIKMLVSLP